MFFVIIKLLSVLLLMGFCFYGFIAWARKAEMKSEVAEAIIEIDQMLELYKDIPKHKLDKVRLARKRLYRLINKGEQ